MDFLREIVAERVAWMVALVTLCAVAPTTTKARAEAQYAQVISATAPEAAPECVWGIEPPGPETCAQ